MQKIRQTVGANFADVKGIRNLGRKVEGEQKMSEELKPCPFCRGEAMLCVSGSQDDKVWFYIVCGDCGTCSDHVSAKEIAVRIWNTRPEEERLKAENERLKDTNLKLKDQKDE